MVATVESGTPAEKAGIQGGSQSESYNGLSDHVRRRRDREHRRRAGAELGGRVADRDRAAPAWQSVQVVVLRDGTERRSVRVTLGERPLAPTD